MTKYLLTYHGGDQPSSKEEGERVTQSWIDWLGGLGKSVVEPGNPTTVAKTIAPSGKVSDAGGAKPVTGYTILEAKSLDDAVKLAKGSPQLKANGSIEVSEIMVLMSPPGAGRRPPPRRLRALTGSATHISYDAYSS